MQGTNENPTIVIGSLVLPSRVSSFTFDPRTEELQLDHYEPQTELSELTASQQHRLAQSIRQQINNPWVEIRLGEYYCENCKQWVAATKTQWSVGICLSCSLDRGTELADDLHSE